jgi:hypothetical protein
MKTRYIVAGITALALLEIGALTYLFSDKPTTHGGSGPFLAPPTIDVELLDTPAPIIFNGCFRSLIRGPQKPVTPCAVAPTREAAPAPIEAPAPSYVPPVASYTRLPDPAPTPIWSPPAVLPPVLPPAPGYVPREMAHTGGGFFDRNPPCYRSETPCPR